MSFKIKFITLAIASIIILFVGPKTKEKFWKERPPIPEQVWLDPKLATAVASAGSVNSEQPSVVDPRKPIRPTPGEWIKQADEKDTNGRIIERWSCESETLTAPITIKGWKVSFNIKAPVMMGFRLPTGIVVWFSDNAKDNTQYLEVSPGVLSTESGQRKSISRSAIKLKR